MVIIFIADCEKKDTRIQNFVGHLGENVGTNNECISVVKHGIVKIISLGTFYYTLLIGDCEKKKYSEFCPTGN